MLRLDTPRATLEKADNVMVESSVISTIRITFKDPKRVLSAAVILFIDEYE